MMLEQALRNAALGRPILPCKPGTKVPATPHGKDDATTDPEQLRLWWSIWPDANPAMATGAPAVDVLDVDTKPEGSGFAAFNRAKNAGLLGGAVTLVNTPSGGLHVYYAGTAQRCGALPKHFLDFKANGGYVLLPPSVIDERDPKAANDPGRRGRYEVIQYRDIEPAELDWPAIKRLLNPPPVPRTRRGRSPGGIPPWLSERLADLNAPDRSAHFHGTVGACWRAGLSQAEAVALLTPWCEAVNKYADRVAAEVARSWAKIEGPTE